MYIISGKNKHLIVENGFIQSKQFGDWSFTPLKILSLSGDKCIYHRIGYGSNEDLYPSILCGYKSSDRP
jgi:hypothetical protein